MAPKPKSSRRLPPDKLRTSGLPLRLTEAERSLVDRAADLDHDKPYNWGRRMLVIVAEHRIQGVTIQEAYAVALAAKKPK
jgi:hypothetical protein